LEDSASNFYKYIVIEKVDYIDCVWHDDLMYKLYMLDYKSNCLRILKAMYCDMQSAVIY